MYNINSESNSTKTVLVATKVPEWTEVLTKFGVSQDPNGPIVWHDLLVDFVNLRVMRATDVWLEWRWDGITLPVSDTWARVSYVLVADLTVE